MVDGVLTERLKDEKVNSDPQMAARAGSRSSGRNQGERRGGAGEGGDEDQIVVCGAMGVTGANLKS